MKNFRDIENLSAYLDGQLGANESTQLESRLKSDLELESALRDLRAARSILRQLPQRKAPRNFTLTRQMVGLKPPLPRSYPLIRFATVFASILFLFSFTATALSPYVSFGYSAAAPAASFGMGGGCDGPCEEAALEQPAATEEAFAAEMAPAITEAAPAADAQEIQPTEGVRVIEPTPSMKEGEPSAEETAPETATQPEVAQEAQALNPWTMLFFIVSIAGLVSLWAMRQVSKNKWQ